MRRRSLLASAVSTVVVLLSVLAVLLLRTEPERAEPVAEPPPGSPVPTTPLPATPNSPTAAGSTREPEPDPAGDAADTYARAVAQLVFAMDTRHESSDDYRSRIFAEADPGLSPTGRADLERLLDARVPSDDRWHRMSVNEQWAEWRPMDVYEPGTWEQMVTGGLVEPGWEMRNVMGIQTVHYRDGGSWRTAARERTVTVGMRCPTPDGAVPLERCRLLLLPVAVVA